MPNLEKQFGDFVEKVSIKNTDSKAKTLIKSRESAEKRIEEYFKSKKIKLPTFIAQGSFVMDTIINPIDGEFDLDDGIYLDLNGLPDNFPDSSTTSTAHAWVKEALENQTKDGVTDKNNCVRLTYAKQYHIDFPIYALSDSKQLLAHKAEGWIESYPQAFINWYNSKANDGIKNIVILLKAWKDYCIAEKKLKFPSGMIFTVLAIKYYQQDDEIQYSFLATCKEIKKALSNGFVLNRPVKPFENLFMECSDEKKENLKEMLNELIKEGDEAVKTKTYGKASEHWIKVFGNRFPKSEEPIPKSAPAIISSDHRSA